MNELSRLELTANQLNGGLLWVFLLSVLAIDAYRRRFRFTWGKRLMSGVLANLVIAIANSLLIGPVVIIGVTAVQHWINAVGLPTLPSSLWEPFPRWALIAFSVVAIDFSDYWSHRLLHTRWFWPIHAIHHSDPDVTATTSLRVHALEGAVMTLTTTILLGWLGMPPVDAGLAAILKVILNCYVHVNVDWTHGPLRLWIASPRWHRWHHADVPAAYGKNLASIFPMFDVLFGTHYEPGPCRERLGGEGLPENNFLLLMIWPFIEWGKMIAAAFPRAKTLSSDR